ncbi:MAG: alpha/beta fold hydrolase [Bacteroidota bacterium]
MPLVESTYTAPNWLKNPHVNTIFSSKLRKPLKPAYQRERIDTPDDDFLDLDWSKVGSNHLAILLHGLEGGSGSNYILGLASYLNDIGIDVLAINFRSCSGEMNRQLRVYHSGETTDTDYVLSHVEATHSYKNIFLVGFSLGGNVCLKFLGEQAEKGPSRIKAAVAVSVPVDLGSSSHQLDHGPTVNQIYVLRFILSLNKKLKIKQQQFPGKIDVGKRLPRTIFDFDNRFTGPLHGFEGAVDYYTRSSSKPYLSRIQVPTLLINALDDPFLSDKCYPMELAADHPYLYLETPEMGGHVGFNPGGRKGFFWSEKRVGEFLANYL